MVKLFREIVAAAKYATFEALLQHIEAVGKTLQDCGPKGTSPPPLVVELTGAELVVTNITRRVLKFLTEEYQTALSAFLLASTSHSSTSSIPSTPHTPGWGLSGLETPGTFFPERGDPFAFTSRVDGAGEGKFRGIGGSMFDLLGHKGDSTSAQGAGDKFSAGKDHLWSAQNSPGLSAPNSPSKLFSTLPSSFDKPALSRIATSTSGQLSPHVTTMLEEDFSKKAHNLKPVFIEAIQELIDEVEMTQRSVGEQSLDHIHSGEFILTVGKSRTVEAFLKNASRKRKFTVIVAETAPSYVPLHYTVSADRAPDSPGGTWRSRFPPQESRPSSSPIPTSSPSSLVAQRSCSPPTWSLPTGPSTLSLDLCPSVSQRRR